MHRFNGKLSTYSCYFYGKKSIGLNRFCPWRVLFLAIISGLLFGLAWCSKWLGWLLTLSIVPLLYMAQYIWTYGHSRCMGLYIKWFFFAFVLWNSFTIWWLWHAAFEALLFVIAYNAFCLTLPWCFYAIMVKKFGQWVGYVGLVVAWLTLEHAHLSWKWWELSFPWLNLGNGLSALLCWIQWYEYTGILGGSLWILGINILVYHLLFIHRTWYSYFSLGSWVLLPLGFSVYIYAHYQEQGLAIEAVVVQPNLDSYTEKNPSSPHFVSYAKQVERLINLSKAQLLPKTCLVIWPESALDYYINEEFVFDHPTMYTIGKFLKAHPTVQLITGVSSYRNYGAVPATRTACKYKHCFLDYFNSVFFLKSENYLDIYHKTKRLPGAEYLPYLFALPSWLIDWVKSQLWRIGNIDPCLGEGNGAHVFALDQRVGVAPINCYESLYGNFGGQACRKGANLFAVVTNDGWWGNTPIYHQHFHYSRLLAISHRRSVMRAANTGISGFINQRGDILAKTVNLTAASLRQKVYANSHMTFYSLHGDYMGYIAEWIVLLLTILASIAWLWTAVGNIMGRLNNRKYAY